MENRRIVFVGSEDNPDNREVHCRIAQYAVKLGVDYRWRPVPGDAGPEAFSDTDAAIVEEEIRAEMVLSEGVSCPPIFVRCGGHWTKEEQDRALKKGVKLETIAEQSEEAVAELALTLILALKRKVIRHHEQVLEGKMIRHMASQTLGTTVGIVGLENGGKQLAKWLESMGCRVLVWQPEPAAGRSFPSLSLEDLTREADIISLHISYEAVKRTIVDGAFLARMKRTAVLVNTGDGRIVDTNVLFTALKEKWIEAAALDTLPREVIEGDNPFRTVRNVILTPGIGRMTKEVKIRRGCEAVAAAVRLLKHANG